MGNCLRCFKEKKIYTDYDQLYDHLNNNKEQYVTVFIERRTTNDSTKIIPK